MIKLPAQLKHLTQQHHLKLEEMEPLKGIWANYTPGMVGKYNAHYITDRDNRSCFTRPHGKEWQATYKQLVQENLDLFPEDAKVLDLFIRYTSARENELVETLQKA